MELDNCKGFLTFYHQEKFFIICIFYPEKICSIIQTEVLL